MEDLILGLLSAIVEVFGEVLLQLVAELLFDLSVRSVRNVFGESRAIQPIAAGLYYLLIGIGAGGLSIGLFPHPLFHHSRFHGVSLIVSPLITGAIMSSVGLLRRRRGSQPVRIESFWYGFTFALGVALVRVIFAQ